MWVGTLAALTDPTSDPGWATGGVGRGQAAPAVLGMAFPPMEATSNLTTPLSVSCLVSSEASNFHPRLSLSLLYFPKKFPPEFSLIPSLGVRKMRSGRTQDSWEPQRGGRQ